MKKLITLLLVLTGMVNTVNAGKNLTVYYAIPTNVTGYDNVKLNVNHRGWGDSSGDWWESFAMTKTSKTYFGKYIYSCTFYSQYDGAGVIQFQLYNGSSYVSQVDAFACTESNKFLSGSAFDGKMWEYDNTDGKWRSYNYDKSVTFHCNKVGEWTPSYVYYYFNDGNNDVQTSNDWAGNETTASTLNTDYYDYTATGKPCTIVIVNNGDGGGGNESDKISIGDNSDYWITDGASSTTASDVAPAGWIYSRSVTNGNYGTICLPYAVSNIEGATIYKIVSTVGSGDAMTAINIEEVAVANVEAGKAYIYKATDSQLKVTYTGGSPTSVTEAYGMKGNLAATIKAPENSYVIGSDNLIHKVVSGGKGVNVGQFKGYITLTGISAVEARGFDFIAFDNESTGIETVKQQVKANGEYYNLAGQRVAQPAKGLYIVNGKKVIMK